ncbi:hypothetical protein [Dysgonomonas sp. 520]|uniref:hypothetical protein n=1 Tax=Dysgonomonas sp. 520 TaxID=2302931 RepID=UPI0013D31546|nr:hypothetical protein [Dysgonomonas sp. 520]NDW11270.1 hypothetical protein [Dysgonomonas sp. 520]
MVDLWKYYKEEDWIYLLSNTIPLALNENKKHLEYVSSLNIFPDDICKVLAVYYDYMFEGKDENFQNWLVKKQSLLDNETPISLMKLPNGVLGLKVYLLRYPLLL